MYSIYLVPHTHYDVAWAFTKEEYLKINEEIIDEAVALMESSEFKFCLEQTFLLKELERRNPDRGQRIEEMIKAGKLEIVDGQYTVPDSMLPTGEVLIRNIFVGKEYCKGRFGVEIPVAWAADSFGMNAQLPQIYRKAGYKWLAFRRGVSPDLKESEFLWKGLDGTTILAHWMPLGYRAGLYIDEWEDSFVKLNQLASTPCILMPCGSGSIPPQPEIPRAVKDWNQTHHDIGMTMATPREFFQDLEKCQKEFEVVEGELYDDEVVDVFPHVCSSRVWIVQGFRECEKLLITAEKFATISWLLGAQYPTTELKQAWEQILFVSSHDIVAGCGVDEIYEEVREILPTLKISLSEILTKALRHITEKINTGGKGTVVFNPLPWHTTNWVEGIGEEGFLAKVPSLGYKVHNLTAKKKKTANAVVTGDNSIVTAFWTIEVNQQNGTVKVFDKAGNLLANGNEMVIEDEVGDLYRHTSRFYPELIKSESGEGFQFGSFKPRNFWIEQEESRVKVVFETEYYCLTWPYRQKERFSPVLYKYKTLDIRKEIIIYRDIPRVEFRTMVDNNYPNIRLRVKFDTGIDRKTYCRETQFGVIREFTEYFTRTGGAEPSAPHSSLGWFDLSDSVRGVTFMNKGLPGAQITEGSVYITLFRSVGALSADGTAGPLVPTPDALEQRSFAFEYAIQPHYGDWQQADIHLRAQEYQHAPFPIEAHSDGVLAPEFSFLQLSPDNLVLSALKKAEDSDEVILRFFETKGQATEATIRLFKEIRRLTLVDVLEREETELAFSGNTFRLEVKPFEIITVKLELQSGRGCVSALEQTP